MTITARSRAALAAMLVLLVTSTAHAAQATTSTRERVWELGGRLSLAAIAAANGAPAAAVNKVYQYRACIGPAVSPFVRRWVAHAPRAHDLDRMREAAALLLGRHDFEAFTVADRETLTSVRELRRLDVDREGDEVVITAEADGFLRAMVRTLAGTLLAAGEGRLRVESVAEALATKRREFAGPTAPAAGLTLVRVDY